MADLENRRMRRVALASLIGIALLGSDPHAQVAMPAASEMSGIPLPSADLEDGTIVVRLVRGQLSNNIVDHPVELLGAGDPRTSNTDESGRAHFAGVPAGTSVQAVAELPDGERVVSETFAVPASGGVRVMLVASGSAGGPVAAAPAGPGTVTLAGETRFVLELGDDDLEVYYLFDVINAGSTAVTPDTPVVFDLPARATGVTLLQGSSNQARLSGTRLEIVPPFAPGPTHVEVAFFLPYGNGTVSLAQPLPIPLSQLTVVAQRPAGMQLQSAQISTSREVESQGRTFIVANGGGLAAGAVVQLELTGLPHYSMTPTYLALAIAVVVLAGGVWTALGTGSGGSSERREKLEARRETLLTALARLEDDRRAGHLDESRYSARRAELFTQLERIYRSLDDPITS